jgi:hypothetical protein
LRVLVPSSDAIGIRAVRPVVGHMRLLKC